MANTKVQLCIEDYIRNEWLTGRYRMPFKKKPKSLCSGGLFEFDAVSDDDKIVANISTSSGTTAGGKHPAGKVQKLRADMLFLTMVNAETKLIILTEKDMYELCMTEKKHGRVPVDIDFELVVLPTSLASRLVEAKREASTEVSPNR